MDAARWQEVSQIFEAALDLPAAEREPFLAARCGDDLGLRHEVERMLVMDGSASFLERPAIEVSGFDVPSLNVEGLDVQGLDVGGLDLPLSPGVGGKVGRYEIAAVIGRGGFGDVFRGWDPLLKRPVAIKTCPWAGRALRERFAREAEIAARLDHPHITQVYDFGIEGATPYLVQELLTGEDLAVRLDREPGPPPVGPSLAARLSWLRQLAQGLAYAHRQGVVHRDIKPGNLRLVPGRDVAGERLKIMDFGIAQLADAASSLTQTGAVLGTAAYMAPEQIRGGEVDGRVDVYAFGAVAHELLAGEPPFGAGSGPSVLYRILEQPAPALAVARPELPAALAALVERCLAKRPEERYPSFDEVLAALDRQGAGTAVTVARPVAVVPASGGDEALRSLPSPAGPLVASRAKGRREPGRSVPARRWLAAGLAAGLLAFLAMAWQSREAGRRGPGSRLEAPNPAQQVAVVNWASEARGSLHVDALPWAEVTAIRDAAGREQALPAQRFTPLAMELPPGEYAVTLRHPRSAEPHVCQVRITAARTVDCKVEIARVDARRFLRQAGW